MEQLNPAYFEKTILPWLGKTGKMLHLFMGDKFKQHGINLSVEQFVILKILHDADGLPQNNISLVANRHKATLTRLLDNMEDKHLVARIPDPSDKRVKKIYLTKHGRQLFESVLPVLKEAMEEVQKGLTKDEINTLISLLKKVQSNIHFDLPQKGCSTN